MTAQQRVSVAEFKKLLAADTREGDVQAPILKYLRMRRVHCWRVNVQGVPIWKDGAIVDLRPAPDNAVGAPDICGTLPWGQAFGIECKRPVGGRHGSLQLEWEYGLKRSNGVYLLATSLDQVTAWLEPLLDAWAAHVHARGPAALAAMWSDISTLAHGGASCQSPASPPTPVIRRSRNSRSIS